MRLLFLALLPNLAFAGPLNASNPLALAALKLLASQHQSCDVLNPVNFSETNHYVATRATACKGRPYERPSYSQAIREPRFTKLPSGNFQIYYPHEKTDCSGFATGAIATAAWRYTAGKDIEKSAWAPNTAVMIEWGKNKSDCFEPAPITRNGPALLPGDLTVQRWKGGGHVSIVASVSDTMDPFGLANAEIESLKECEDPKLNVRLKLERVFTGITMIDSNDPILSIEDAETNTNTDIQLQDGSLHSYYDRQNLNATDLVPYMRKLCRARLGGRESQAITKNGDEAFAILRHKNTPECQSSVKLIPKNFDCVANCSEWHNFLTNP